MSIMDDIKVGDVLYVPIYGGFGREPVAIYKLTVVSTPKTMVRMVMDTPIGYEVQYRASRVRNEHKDDWPIKVSTPDRYGFRDAWPEGHPELDKARACLERQQNTSRATTSLDAAQRAMRQGEPEEALEHCRRAVEWLEKVS